MRILVNMWNWNKRNWSRLNDWIKRGEPRKPVPLFDTPLDAARYLWGRVQYVSDPLGGLLDWYVHPERLQAAMETGFAAVKAIPGVDCDDFAVWACAALRQIQGCKPQLLTLYDASGKFGHHVICVFEMAGSFGAIDTNGFHSLPDLIESTICCYWSAIYQPLGYRYTEAIPTPFPF